ncbi:MAG: hypothetical protein RL594_1257 [Bacteroidota bacterium]|jgi:hypothetical protein
MPKIVLILLAGLGTFLVLVSISALISRIFVRRSITRLVRTISKERLPTFTKQSVQGLPTPVQRYLLSVVPEGTPNLRYAILQQTARFRHRPGSPWFRITATETISGMEPGFVWDAVLRHNAAWWRTAKLSYVRGEGHGHIKLYGAMTLQEYDGKETDTSMLFRFLSELIWIPTAFLPTKTLRWEGIDDRTARAIISDGSTRVNATFHFNEADEIERIVTSDKYRDHKSGFEQAKFTMYCRAYRVIDGIKIPTEVEFVWNLDSGDFDYGHFKITDAAYYFS